MVERQNYLKVKSFLKYMEEVQQVSKGTLERYSSSLKYLLLWADDQLLGDSISIRPTLQAYLIGLPGKKGNLYIAPESQKRAIEIAKRFSSGPRRSTQENFRRFR